MAKVTIILTDTPEGRVNISTQFNPPLPADPHAASVPTKAEIMGMAVMDVAMGVHEMGKPAPESAE